MYMHNKFSVGISLLLCGVLVSCQKETTPAAGEAGASSNKKTTTGLVQGPPTIVWWANGIAVPYVNQFGTPAELSQDAAGFSINGKGYLCGGGQFYEGTGGVYSSDLWEYDPSGPIWTKKAPIPAAVNNAVAFVIGGKAYLVLGNTTWQYDPAVDQWSQKASLPTVNRQFGSGFAINGKGYVGLGYDDVTTAFQNDWWEYDPSTEHWTAKKKFPGTKVYAAPAFSVGGKGYIVSGRHGAQSFPTAVWQYNPATDNWTQKADFPGEGRSSAVGASGTVDGVDVGFVAGGVPGTPLIPINKDAWEYFPASDTWGRLPDMPGGGRTDAGWFVINRSLFIANISVVVLNWSN